MNSDPNLRPIDLTAYRAMQDRMRMGGEQQTQEPATQQPVADQTQEAVQPQEEEGEEEDFYAPRPFTLEQTSRQKEESLWTSFQKGLERSASGEIKNVALGQPGEPEPEAPPGFWNSVFEMGGEVVGDVPFMMIGQAIGGVLGGAVGSRFGTVGGGLGTAAGAGFGTMALPSFLKEAAREYRAFQDAGGDMTFGEFIGSADRVANKTLREGAFGVVLGAVNRAMPLLTRIPAVNQLFNTRYVGPAARHGTTLAAETGAATVIPAAVEGRLPDAEDAAKAAILFAGMKTAGALTDLPNLKAARDQAKSKSFDVALADEIESLNLAFPPLQEFKIGENPIYKTSEGLDRNIAAFDLSVVDNIVSKIQNISAHDFPSADKAGREIFNRLGETVAIKIPERLPAEPEPVKPEFQERPAPMKEEFVAEEKPKPSTLLPLPEPPKTLVLPPLGPEIRFGEAPVEPAPEAPSKEEIPLLKNPLKVAAETISKQEAPTKSELGRRIKKEYQTQRNVEKGPLEHRYDQLEKGVEGITIVEELAPQQIQEFINDFEPEAIEGSAAAKVVKYAEMARDLFLQYDAEGNTTPKEVALKKLIGVTRSIKKIPNWQIPPNMLTNLGKLTDQLDTIIQNHISFVNEPLAAEYLELNRDYALFKNRWDNADMKIFWDKTVNDEAIANRFTQIDSFKQLAEAFENTVYGDEVLNLVRRRVWTERVGKEAIEAKTEAAFEKATSKLDNQAYSELMEYLSPYQRLELIQNMMDADGLRQSALQTAEMFEAKKAEHAKKVVEHKERVAEQKKKESKEEKDAQREFERLEKERVILEKEINKREKEKHKKEEKERLQKRKEKYEADLEEYKKREEARKRKIAEKHARDVEEHKKREQARKKKEEREFKEEMKRWKEAEAKRSNKEKKLREDVQAKKGLLVSLLKENPADLLANMSTIEGIRRMKKTTKLVPNGGELYDALARFETQRMFEFMKEGYIRNGRVPYTELKIKLQNKEFRAKLQELNGEGFVRDLDELVRTTDKLSKNFREKIIEYRDDPTTANTILQIYAILGLAQGNVMTPLMAFTAKKNLIKLAGRAYTSWMDNRNYNAERTKDLLEAAKAVQSGKKSRIRDAANRLRIPYWVNPNRRKESNQETQMRNP